MFVLLNTKPTPFTVEKGVEDRRLLKIENIVTTSSSKCPRLKRLNREHAHVFSHKVKGKRKVGSKFSSVRYKSQRPKATTLVFGSGNQVVAGTKSQSQAILAHYSFVEIISDVLGTKSTQAERFKIQNIVASCHYGYNLDLETLSEKCSSYFSYDPKLFPGARGKIEGHPTSMLLFTSGNGVITGAKNEEDIVKAFDTTYHMIKPYFKEKSDPHADKGSRYRHPDVLDDPDFVDRISRGT